MLAEGLLEVALSLTIVGIELVPNGVSVVVILSLTLDSDIGELRLVKSVVGSVGIVL